jgi:hypothetical protein
LMPQSLCDSIPLFVNIRVHSWLKLPDGLLIAWEV